LGIPSQFPLGFCHQNTGVAIITTSWYASGSLSRRDDSGKAGIYHLWLNPLLPGLINSPHCFPFRKLSEHLPNSLSGLSSEYRGCDRTPWYYRLCNLRCSGFRLTSPTHL